MHPGEIWLADRSGESRRLVFAISDGRFRRLAERAVVAPLLDAMPAVSRPWHIAFGEQAIAVNQVATLPIDRLLKRVDRAGFDTLRRVRVALQQITS